MTKPQIYVIPEVVGRLARAFYGQFAGDHVSMGPRCGYKNQVTVSCLICNTQEHVTYDTAIHHDIVRAIRKHAHS